jgi:hypothetical protein
VEKQNERITSDETAATADGSGPATHPSTDGLVIAPLATAAALDPSVFSKVSATEAIPATWEERARKAWEYYIEEPLVKNCVNFWRTFAVGDEIKITSDDEDVKSDAGSLADRLNISAFVKDMRMRWISSACLLNSTTANSSSPGSRMNDNLSTQLKKPEERKRLKRSSGKP